MEQQRPGCEARGSQLSLECYMFSTRPPSQFCPSPVEADCSVLAPLSLSLSWHVHQTLCGRLTPPLAAIEPLPTAGQLRAALEPLDWWPARHSRSLMASQRLRSAAGAARGADGETTATLALPLRHPSCLADRGCRALPTDRTPHIDVQCGACIHGRPPYWLPHL